jgi:predicted nucleic acid-binding protein
VEERGTALTFVLDCSAFGPILLADEASDILPGLKDALAAGEAIVPQHWQIEVASSVQAAIRRRRLPEGTEVNATAILSALEVQVDPDTSRHLWSTTWKLAQGHGLTVYDAAYLELALRLGAPLATHDRSLLRAASTESLPLFGR